jgi:hypothetical protein
MCSRQKNKKHGETQITFKFCDNLSFIPRLMQCGF